MEKSWGMKEIVSVSLFYVVKSPNFNVLSLQLLKLLSIKKREILEKSRKNKIFIISGFNGGHRNDKKSPGLPFMLEIPMSDPLVYS
jgi:hypothetical protein